MARGTSIPIYRWRQMRQGQLGGGFYSSIYKRRGMRKCLTSILAAAACLSSARLPLALKSISTTAALRCAARCDRYRNTIGVSISIATRRNHSYHLQTKSVSYINISEKIAELLLETTNLSTPTNSVDSKCKPTLLVFINDFLATGFVNERIS